MIGLQGGGFLAGTPSSRLVRFDAAGRVVWAHQSETLHRAGQVISKALQTSASGDVVQFNLKRKERYVGRFSLRDGKLEPTAHRDPSLDSTIIENPNIRVENWVNSDRPRLNGQAIKLDPYERSRSYAISPNGRRLVLGTSWSLRAYTWQGDELWRQDVPSDPWSVTITGDGRTVVAAYGDGTIRWHDLEDGRELLALFPQVDSEQWVAWTPEGFFRASENGAKLIGYHINRDLGEAPDFIHIDQMSENFFRPDLLVHRLQRNETPIRLAIDEIGDVKQLLTKTRHTHHQAGG